MFFDANVNFFENGAFIWKGVSNSVFIKNGAHPINQEKLLNLHVHPILKLCSTEFVLKTSYSLSKLSQCLSHCVICSVIHSVQRAGSKSSCLLKKKRVFRYGQQIFLLKLHFISVHFIRHGFFQSKLAVEFIEEN